MLRVKEVVLAVLDTTKKNFEDVLNLLLPLDGKIDTKKELETRQE